MTDAERARRYRDRKRRGEPSILEPCGTRAAFIRHRRNGEDPCEPCREAYNAYHRQYNQTKSVDGGDPRPSSEDA